MRNKGAEKKRNNYRPLSISLPPREHRHNGSANIIIRDNQKAKLIAVILILLVRKRIRVGELI